VAKAARILGLKYVELQVDDDHRIQPEAVGELDLERTALVLTAGTVASGAVDRLDIGAAAAWRHVDAAWGGPLRFSRRHRARLEGVQHADSVSVSAHKLLFQPKECAAVLFAEPKEAHDTISFGGGYISVPNIGLLGSHGATALPLAASLLAWGRDGIEQLIDHTMSLAERLADIVEATDELELWRRPTTGVLLWRPTRVSPMEAHRKLCGAHVSLTNVRGEQWLRSVAANPNADPDLVAAQVLAAAPPD
jgi:L-2,4-diaminobutyrate decarboxylase